MVIYTKWKEVRFLREDCSCINDKLVSSMVSIVVTFFFLLVTTFLLFFRAFVRKADDAYM